MVGHILYSEATDLPVAIFKTREDAFAFLKIKENGSENYSIKPVPVYGDVGSLKQYKFYTASCNLGDTEITVTEMIFFPEIEPDAPKVECTSVDQYGAKVTCAGTDLQKVSTALRAFIARKRYEFEHAVRRVCDIVQPTIENNEAMTVNQIVDESGIDQDTVVKILILLKKEGFLDIVDPVEEMTKTQENRRAKLWTPQQEAASQNVGVTNKGEIIKKDPNKGLQATFPIKKYKRK
jgi:hypothetical protein